MKILRPAVLTLLASLAGLASAQTSNWTIDSHHSTAQFTVRHMGISNVSGSFTQVSGSAVINDKDITQSQVNALIDVKSVDTRVPDRDNDLRSPNFFDAEKYPTIEFKSKRIVNNCGKLQMIGDLTDAGHDSRGHARSGRANGGDRQFRRPAARIFGVDDDQSERLWRGVESYVEVG